MFDHNPTNIQMTSLRSDNRKLVKGADMQYLIRNVIVPLSSQPDYRQAASAKLRVPVEQLESCIVMRRSLDARKRNQLKWNFTLLAEFAHTPHNHPDMTPYNEKPLDEPSSTKLSQENPVIIGAGPAGLFAAVAMVENGLKPWIFDRGDEMTERIRFVEDFWHTGELDPESNAQFGEGGAGTFSDGKLTARSRDGFSSLVFENLIRFGAPEDIRIDAHPHLGSDCIRAIIVRMRKWLEESGCRFFWRHKLEDLTVEKDRVTHVRIGDMTISPEIVVIALGNSARDTFEMLHESGVRVEAKPFAIGFRIEHPRTFIDEAFYGEKTDFSLSGAATYRMTAKAGNYGVYTFCMCPGGEVIAAASEPDCQVTNGMSYSKRDAFFSNSAVVVTVNEKDFGSKPLDGIHFQRKIEQKCFNPQLPYFAPTQSAGDFCGIRKASLARNSYRPGTYNIDLRDVYPKALTRALQTGMKHFEQLHRDFICKGVLIAPETRTSSPVRILRRQDNGSSVNCENLYPIGEGSGYAGGIVSSAVDGYRLGRSFRL